MRIPCNSKNGGVLRLVFFINRDVVRRRLCDATQASFPKRGIVLRVGVYDVQIWASHVDFLQRQRTGSRDLDSIPRAQSRRFAGFFRNAYKPC